MQCKNCLECIADGAKKCRHCGTYQGYWHKINSASSLIALASGLSALAILIIPIAKEQLGRTDSEIDYSYINQTSDSISFFISNTGERAGTIGSFSIPLDEKIRLRPVDREGRERREGQAIMLEAGKSTVVTLVPEIKEADRAVEKLANKYEVSAKWVRETMKSLELSEESFSEAYYLYSKLGDRPSDFLGKVDSLKKSYGCILAARTLSFRGKPGNAFLLSSNDDEVFGACDRFVYSIYSTRAWRRFNYILTELENGDG